MNTTSSHGHINIDCTLAQAKAILAVLNLLDDQLVYWSTAPTNTDSLPAEAADWPLWAKKLCVQLSGYLFNNEWDCLSFDYLLALPTVQGRPVESETNFQGLILQGDHIDDDLFEAAHLIIKALESPQLISTGTAYIGDNPDPFTFCGNYVVVSQYGWKYLVDYDDVTASEVEAAQDCAYWLVTIGSIHNKTTRNLLWIANAADQESEVRQELTDNAKRVGLPEEAFTLTQIPGTTFRHLKGTIPTHESARFTDRPEARSRNAA